MELALIAAIFSVLGGGGLIGWWRTTRPSRDRAATGWDAILGEGPILDRNGKVMQEGQPGLIHRVSEVEHAVKTLAEVVANQHAMNRRVEAAEYRLDRHDRRFEGHDESIAALIASTFERGANATLTAAERLKDADG